MRAGWHRALILDWVAANPPGIGSGWEPYPTSLRIVNWIKWALAGHELPPEAVASLAVQARWLTKRLEWHLLGNHLFANAKALLFVGLWFDGPEAARWRQRALSILALEVPEQILPDGGQFELSPMYHALAIEDLLDLVNLVRARGRPDDVDLSRAAADWCARLSLMFGWLAILSHPDGRIAFFNDSAFGIAAENAELAGYAGRLGLVVPHPPAGALRLPNSGYARLAKNEAVLLADLAPIGPDYLPGHAHADTLSFELSLGTQRVVVNSGTSVYGFGAERLRQRGTAAHSTVTLGNCDSSEVWSGFRVGRRARVIDAGVGGDADTLWAEGAHDGYVHLPGHPVHRRRWELGPTGLRVSDSLAGDEAEARYHLHPDIEALQDEPHAGHLLLPNGRSLRWIAEGGSVHIARSSWHPEFGLSLPTSCLVVPLRDGQATLSLNWA
ncbi:heparinase II/III family protein [Oceanicola granulosus]|uniref:heparinase II/III family protein n=1 Tax=Oceanicola granulosus TaxID=252302 RepID=UPI00192B564C|nr:alginate lyase family protein [Oceanicola granulosus]